MITEYRGPLEIGNVTLNLAEYFLKSNPEIWADDPGFQYVVQAIAKQVPVLKPTNICYHRYQLAAESWHVSDDVVAQSTSDKVLDAVNEADVLDAAKRLAFTVAAIKRGVWETDERGDAAPNILFRFKDDLLAKPSILTIYCRFAAGSPRRWHFLCRVQHVLEQYYWNAVTNRPLVWYGFGSWLSSTSPTI